MRKRKPASDISRFLRKEYGISWRDISSKLRSGLLLEMEEVPCNLCHSTDNAAIAAQDKYRLPLTTVVCNTCGLMFLNPRPTATAYRRFYEEGGDKDSVYHRRLEPGDTEILLKFYYGDNFEMDAKAKQSLKSFVATRDHTSVAVETTTGSDQIDYYGKHIYEWLKEHVPRGGKVFEPGASTGKMLYPWKVLHGCEVAGVEPKRATVQLAKDRYGIHLIQGFADSPRIPENTYDLVLNTRTINHMLDPLGDLRRAWRWLKPGGILFVDIQDVIQETRYEGFERNVVEIDHPYMFSQNTLNAMIELAGFLIFRSEVVDLQQARDWDDRPPQYKQIRTIARKMQEGSTQPRLRGPAAEIIALLRAQLEFDRKMNDEFDSMKRKYRALKDHS